MLIENLTLLIVMSLQDTLLRKLIFINILSLRDKAMEFRLIISAKFCEICGKNAVHLSKVERLRGSMLVEHALLYKAKHI